MSKFETLSSFEESGVTVLGEEFASNPKRNVFFLNREHGQNRTLVTNLLAEYVHSGKSVLKPVRCLDALGACGISGLLWKKHLGDQVDVVVNNPANSASEVLKKNADANGLRVVILNKDPCVLLHETSYNFIFLDCYSDASSFLDAALKNIARNGIIAVTTKDDCSLIAANPDLAQRRYSGRILKTCYSLELGIRLVIASMARTAAKYSKAISVLLSVAFKNSFTIAVMVQKGPLKANQCLEDVRPLSHCMTCEDRQFHPVDTGFPVDANSILKSRCPEGEHVVQLLGPLWAGNIFEPNFIEGILAHAVVEDQNLEAILKLVLEEARCPSKTARRNSEEDDDDDVKVSLNKRQKLDVVSPAFYFNLHKHHPKVSHQKSLNRVVEELKNSGFRASKTHFDRLAVRTDAPLEKLYEIMQGSTRK